MTSEAPPIVFTIPSLREFKFTNNNNNVTVMLRQEEMNELIKYRHTKTRSDVMQKLGHILSWYCYFAKFDNNAAMSHQETTIGINIRTPIWCHYSIFDHSDIACMALLDVIISCIASFF